MRKLSLSLFLLMTFSITACSNEVVTSLRIDRGSPTQSVHKYMHKFLFRYNVLGDYSALKQYGMMSFIYNGKATQGKGAAAVSWYKTRSFKTTQPLTLDLRKAPYLYLSMRGRRGDEIVRVAVGKESSKNSGTRSFQKIALSKKWRTYYFDLKNIDLSGIQDLLLLTLLKNDNPSGAAVVVRSIEYTSKKRSDAIAVPYKKEQPAISSQEKYAAAMLERWKNGEVKRGYLQKSVSIQGYLCAKNSWVSFYENGRLKYFFPAKEVTIQEIACQPLSRVSLYPNGKLKECILSKALQRNRRKYSVGSAIAFDKQGRLRKFFYELSEGQTPRQECEFLLQFDPNNKELKYPKLNKFYLIKNSRSVRVNQTENIISDLNMFASKSKKRGIGKITVQSNMRIATLACIANPTAVRDSFNFQRYTKLRIVLRGKRGGESLSFKIGGLKYFNRYDTVQAYYQDSCKVVKGPFVLGRSWQTITIDLSNHDRRSIDNMFTIIFAPSTKTKKRTIYIKEVYYE